MPENKLQFKLVITVFFLTGATMLYGWVYMSSLHNKFDAIIRAPFMQQQDQIKVVQDGNAALQRELDNLKDQLMAISNKAVPPAQAQPAATQEDISLKTLTNPAKYDVVVDSKCFADPNDLNQCAVLASLQINETTRLIVKPLSPITPDMNDVAFIFEQNGVEYTKLQISTPHLTKTDEPLAYLVYIGKSDITLQSDTGIAGASTIYNFDGSGWVNFSQYASQ